MQCPLFEAIEPRQMMSVTLVNGVLNITGTNGNDIITVKQYSFSASLSVRWNGHSQSVAATSVQSIVIDATGGAGSVSLASGRASRWSVITAPVTTPAKIYGGSGNDTIVGGASNDTIYGGTGND